MTRYRAGKDDRKEVPVATMEPSEQIKQLVKREGNRGSEMKGIWNRVPKVSWSLFCCQGSRRHISDIKKEHKSWHETLLLKQYLPSQCSLVINVKHFDTCILLIGHTQHQQSIDTAKSQYTGLNTRVKISFWSDYTRHEPETDPEQSQPVHESLH